MPLLPLLHPLRTALLALAMVATFRQGVRGEEAPAPVQRVSDVIYTKHDGVALTMDIFKPAKPNGAGVIKIISGGWKSNHNGINDGGWPQAGYTTFVVVHGTQPRFHVDEIVADLNRAVRFIRANAAQYGVDPNKLGVTGSSAGGHLSLMLATRGGAGDAKAKDPVDRESSAVNAVACFYPPTDYLNWFGPGDNAVGIGRLAAYKDAFGPVADTAEGREKLGRELSSLYWVHKEQPPVFIVHGNADPQVSHTQSVRFHEKCQQTGAKCEVVIRDGAGHGGWQEMPQDTARMVEWFNLQLLGKEAATPFKLGITTLPSTPGKKPVPATPVTPKQ
ncbi:MAG: prolyl oligopeptidase family serine peptidase [Verrucomicrobium sp.]|nr:alpha/beta hydrolase [Verrucomicrobium sp.]